MLFFNPVMIETVTNSKAMKKDTSKTEVCFLVNETQEEADMFAYFPMMEHRNPFKTAYSHIGQHSACHPDYAKESRPATPEEYQDLFTELESIGYNLHIIN